MGQTRKTDANGETIRWWMTATCPSCGGAKSAIARVCLKCALPLRKRGRKPKPRCACGAPRSANALRCTGCDQRRRHENTRHICEHCGETFFRKKETRHNRSYRTNVFCSYRCKGLQRTHDAEQRKKAKRQTHTPVAAARLLPAPKPLVMCLECGRVCPRRRWRFCSPACSTRLHGRLTRYRERSGISDMQPGDELYAARRSLGAVSFVLQKMGSHAP
jgi:hypothetical protein